MRHPREMAVIQIDVTNFCDGPQCSNCTRMLAYQQRSQSMSHQAFVLAVDSLVGFPGVVGIFGGNPCALWDFDRYALELKQHRHDKSKRGLWTNRWNGNEELCLALFGYINYNDHAGTVYTLKNGVRHPSCPPDGTAPPSKHTSPLVSIGDMGLPPKDFQRLTQNCWVQDNWSACITEIDGVAYAYCCEIIAAWEHVYGQSTGIRVMDHMDWWTWDIDHPKFRIQLGHWCRQCGMPLPQARRADFERTDDISVSHLALAGRCPARHRVEVRGKDYDLEFEEAEHHDPRDYADLRKQP